jgi:anthranilate phosphoribosyltransferase
MPHPPELRSLLRHVIEHRAILSREQAAQLLNLILAGQASDVEIAALVGAVGARGESAAELAGFVDALRAAATQVPLDEAERSLLVDTCGTGGDASGTFNISTAAALVAAAAGATVAKHGNRAVTSACGSADVLEALGIPVALNPAQAAAALRIHRFAFLHAPSLHPAMKAVMPVRRALGVRTVFNVLGPLANPAGARAQVMGVYEARLVPIVAEAMLLLGVRHAFVVHGTCAADVRAGASDAGVERSPSPGIDELSVSGPTHVAELRGGAVAFYQLTPEDAGLESAPHAALRGGDAQINAQILRAIFAGEPGPRRDVVLLNAAAVLIAAGLVQPSAVDPRQAFRSGIELAAKAIDSGAVTALVAALARAEH